jgi:hypothetical protein
MDYFSISPKIVIVSFLWRLGGWEAGWLGGWKGS